MPKKVTMGQLSVYVPPSRMGERIVENAQNFSIPIILELNRVMVHGLLHLLGYKDETRDQKEEIRSKENQYLAFL